eukprot:5469026-Alexandrium_andersonii.AAC.1
MPSKPAKATPVEVPAVGLRTPPQVLLVGPRPVDHLVLRLLASAGGGSTPGGAARSRALPRWTLVVVA